MHKVPLALRIAKERGGLPHRSHGFGCDHDVVGATKPRNLKRLGVVAVVSLDSPLAAAHSAWKLLDKPPLYVGMKICAAVGSSLLFWGQGMVGSPCSHVERVALAAILLSLPGDVWAGVTAHLHALNYITWNGEMSYA